MNHSFFDPPRLWLIGEMLTWLLLAAVIFFCLGWYWRAGSFRFALKNKDEELTAERERLRLATGDLEAARHERDETARQLSAMRKNSIPLPEAETLRNTLTHREEALKHATSIQTALEADLAALRAELSTATSRLEKNSRTHVHNSELEKATTALASQTESATTLAAQKEALAAENRKLSSKLQRAENSLQKDSKAAAQRIKELEKDNARLNKEVNKLSAGVTRKTAARDEVLSTRALVEADLKAAQEAVSRLQAELAAKSTAHSILARDNARLVGQLDALRHSQTPRPARPTVPAAVPDSQLSLPLSSQDS